MAGWGVIQCSPHFSHPLQPLSSCIFGLGIYTSCPYPPYPCKPLPLFAPLFGHRLIYQPNTPLCSFLLSLYHCATMMNKRGACMYVCDLPCLYLLSLPTAPSSRWCGYGLERGEEGVVQCESCTLDVCLPSHPFQPCMCVSVTASWPTRDS